MYVILLEIVIHWFFFLAYEGTGGVIILEHWNSSVVIPEETSPDCIFISLHIKVYICSQQFSICLVFQRDNIFDLWQSLYPNWCDCLIYFVQNLWNQTYFLPIVIERSFLRRLAMSDWYPSIAKKRCLFYWLRNISFYCRYIFSLTWW